MPAPGSRSGSARKRIYKSVSGVRSVVSRLPEAQAKPRRCRQLPYAVPGVYSGYRRARACGRPRGVGDGNHFDRRRLPLRLADGRRNCDDTG